MTIKFFDKSKLEVNTTKLPKYPNDWSHWELMRSLYKDCFGISNEDFYKNHDNTTLLLIDYYHEGDQGQHTVSAKKSPAKKGKFENRWTSVSPKLSDEELPAFVEGMSVACKLIHAMKEKKEG